jgi:hypothetical protein
MCSFQRFSFKRSLSIRPNRNEVGVERSAQRGNAVRWQSCLVKGVAVGDGGESDRRVRFAASGRYTTFLVFGGTRLLPAVARSQLYAILWVLPALMGMPVIFMTVTHYQRKIKEPGRASGVSAPHGQLDS